LSNFEDDTSIFPLQSPSGTPYMQLKLWVTRWVDDLFINKLSSQSIKNYKFAINTFLNFSKRHRDVPIDAISARYINRYLMSYQFDLAKDRLNVLVSEEEFSLLKNELKQSSIGKNDANFTVLECFQNTLSQRLTIVKMFLKFVTENNIEQHDYTKLFDKLAIIKINEKFTDYLTASEIDEVIKYMRMWISIYKDHKPKSSERYAYRDALLLLIYSLSGARSDEVVHIRLRDISLFKKNGVERYIVKIDKGKGGKKRSISIEKKYIHSFIEYFGSHLPNENYYLSSTYKNGYTNKPMNGNTIRAFANKILKNIGINKKGLHSFRRGYVTKRVADDLVDISVVAKEVGNTTAILEKHYLKHSAEAFAK